MIRLCEAWNVGTKPEVHLGRKPEAPQAIKLIYFRAMGFIA